MKKAMCIAAAAILILSLAGCAETAGPAPSESSATPVVNGETSQESTTARETAAHSFSDSKEMPSAPETETATEEPAEESKPDPGTSTEAPAETEKPQEVPATPPKAAETPQPEKPESRSAEPTEPKPSEPPRETQPPAAPEQETTQEPTPEQPPAETQPPMQTEPPAVEEPVEPAFSIDYWIAYAQSYAGSVGLNLDSTATGCWDNPTVAGAHCAYLERDIQSRLNRYAKDDSILDVWIWAESRSDGSYDLYIGYA